MKLKIQSVKSLGTQAVWDIQMPVEPHFLLPGVSGDIVAHNCHAHSVGYAKMGYATAYYKYYARAHFLCSYMNQETSKKVPGTAEYITTIKKEILASGIALKACDINYSGPLYRTTDSKTIVTGLNAIKGLGPAASSHIFANQPYSCFADFIYRSPGAVNKSAIIALAKAGAFDSWNISRKWFVDTFSDEKKGKKLRDKINKLGDKLAEKSPDQDTRIFDWSGYVYDDVPELMTVEYSRRELLMHERVTLGEFVTGSAEEVYSNFFKNKAPIMKADLARMQDFAKVTIEGLLLSANSMKVKTGKSAGKDMGRITIESLKKEDFEVSVWADDWGSIKDSLKEGLPIVVNCNVKRYNGEPGLSLVKIEKIWKDS
jgi:DNA polymerase III alpha subunit